jgi:hypothetical protein
VESLGHSRLTKDLLHDPRLASQENDFGLLDSGKVLIADNLENGRVLPQSALDALGRFRGAHTSNEARRQARRKIL